jgi:hypothetical protein
MSAMWRERGAVVKKGLRICLTHVFGLMRAACQTLDVFGHQRKQEAATTGSSSTKSMRAYSFGIVCISRSLRDRGHSLPERVGSMEGLGRIERTDGDVISVRISERKLRSSSVGIHVWLFFQPADERARPWQSYLKVVDPEEQEEAVARLGVVGTCQRGMLVGTPRVKTEQDCSIRVDDLPEVVVGRSRLRQAK